jgi:hypothetical protein
LPAYVNPGEFEVLFQKRSVFAPAAPHVQQGSDFNLCVFFDESGDLIAFFLIYIQVLP